ncbi:MAG: Mg2+ and Co2+ transporter CorB [Clostridia bacterium]|nr:Mg2+ and Co2+ transporter CorB [Clostridia bacterium]
MDESMKIPGKDKKVKFRCSLLNTKKENGKWISVIIMMTFLLSATLSLTSSKILSNVNNIVAFSVVLVIIVINIVFDIIGMAVASSDEVPFHSMASRKIAGAKQAIWLVRNADKVSAFCNDVVGDICGVISGAGSAFIIYRIVGTGVDAETTLTGLGITALVASMTVGGKAVGKSFAIQNSNYIVYKVSVLIDLFIGRISFKTTKQSKKLKKT